LPEQRFDVALEHDRSPAPGSGTGGAVDDSVWTRAGNGALASPAPPGVVLSCEPKVIDSCCADVGPEVEQLETNATAAAGAATAGRPVSERWGWGMTVVNFPG